MSTILSRRDVGAAIAGALIAQESVRPAAAQDHAMPSPGHEYMPAHWMGKEQIAFLIYPGFTALDMVGPHYMLSNLMGATTHIVARTKEAVTSDTGLVFVPSASFEECPADLDILCVPGGSTGTMKAIEDAATIEFLRDRGRRAKFVTSVCTGSLVLAAAGLLDGYRATSHWVARPLLAKFGAIPVDARVVRDRNRITGAGVTAGIDFGLAMVGQLRDRAYAEVVQLLAEYHPEPPFDAGTPHRAPTAAVDSINAMFPHFLSHAEIAIAKARDRI